MGERGSRRWGGVGVRGERDGGWGRGIEVLCILCAH